MHSPFGNNRGFGGPPQPQRQGGRRGMRGGGGFRGNSRFDHQSPQRNQNQNQGGQRPNIEPAKPAPPVANKPIQQSPQAQKPPAAAVAKPETPIQNSPQQQKPPQKPEQKTPAKVESKDNVDKAAPEQKSVTPTQGNMQNQQPKTTNINGNFGGNKQGGWQNQGNKQGGLNQGNQSGPNSQSGPNQVNKQGGWQSQGNKQGNNQGGPNQKQGGLNQGNTQGGPNQGPNSQSGPNQGIKQSGWQNQGNKLGGPQGVPNHVNTQSGPNQGNKHSGWQNQGNKLGGPNQGIAQGVPQVGLQGTPNQVNTQSGSNLGNNQSASSLENNQGGLNQGNNQGGFNKMNQGGQNFKSGQGGSNNFGQKRSFGGPGGPAGQSGPGGNQPRNWQQRQGGRGPPFDGLKPAQREEHMLAIKLKDLAGPILDLPSLDQSEVKFNGRSRLYIGNLTNDVTEEEITTLFSTYGETAELFLNKEKNFGFIKMDFRRNAERAKHELDGKMRNGRSLRVRFAPHNSAIRVKNLPPFVSNELLFHAFEIFGKIERAYVKVDERGKALGEGVVEYVRKPSALAAIRNCSERCFFLTSSLRPVIVENYEEPDELDGYPEKNLPKKHPEFLKARDMGPRFSELNSFEHEYGTRWKQLHELHRQKEEALKKELAAEEEKLEAQMEYAKYEHETELLREQLRQREQDRERQKRSWEMVERAADERREAERAQLLRQEEELSTRMRHQDDELRRRQQENTLFVQAQRLNSMLDRQEQGMFDQQKPMDGGFREQFETRSGYDDAPQGRGWDGPRPMDDFPNKRRRY